MNEPLNETRIQRNIRRLDRKTWIYGAILAALVLAAFLLPSTPSTGMTAVQVQQQAQGQGNAFQFFRNLADSLNGWANSIADRLR